MVWAGGLSAEPAAERAVIENGKVWRDTAGNEIWCNGGHMIREGDTFYWVGYETAPGRPWSVRLYSSENLADWTFRNALVQKRGEFARLGWAGRPGLLYCRKTARYVLVFEADSRDWFRHKVGFASCARIDGDYKFASFAYPEEGRSTGDQSVFQEGDDAYLVTVLDSPGLKKPLNFDLAIYKLTPDFLGVERKIYEGFDWAREGIPGNEAPHIIKADGLYYWFVSGLMGWNSTKTRYSAARALSGPWSPMQDLQTEPESEDSFNTQHDFVMPVHAPGGTVYLYAGDRYSQWHGKGVGRNIFLPLLFDKGKPVLEWRESWSIDAGGP